MEENQIEFDLKKSAKLAATNYVLLTALLSDYSEVVSNLTGKPKEEILKRITDKSQELLTEEKINSLIGTNDLHPLRFAKDLD